MTTRRITTRDYHPAPKPKNADHWRWDIPRENQGQIVEVSYSHARPSRSEAGLGDRWMRVIDRSDPAREEHYYLLDSRCDGWRIDLDAPRDPAATDPRARKVRARAIETGEPASYWRYDGTRDERITYEPNGKWSVER